MNTVQKIKRRISNFLSKKIRFEDLKGRDPLFLYAGDVPEMPQYEGYVGLSLHQANTNHIRHNVLEKYPLADNSADRYQSEDVFEHIELSELKNVINEIHRVLKPGGLFRLCLPDYQCDLIAARTLRDEKGNFMFDPVGGGKFVDGKVTGGGHMWFPTYMIVKELLEQTNFSNIDFRHYYDEEGKGVTNKIDYSKGHVKRTPDHDARVQNPYRPLSIVVDCIK